MRCRSVGCGMASRMQSAMQSPTQSFSAARMMLRFACSMKLAMCLKHSTTRASLRNHDGKRDSHRSFRFLVSRVSKPSVLLTVRQVEASLNRTLAEYEASSDADTKEFYLLKVQTFIFYYDVLAAMVSIGRNNPKGFAQAVALKSLVHSLYEYDHQMNRTLLPRIMRYASRRRKPVDTRAVKAERGKWRDQLARLRTWKAVRDAATGHYGKDIEHQIRLIKTIDQEEVLSVA